MKILIVLVSVCLILTYLSGRGSKQTNHTGMTTSSATWWAIEFVVYNGDIYKITSDKVTNVNKEIGRVTYSTDKEGTFPGNFSNKLHGRLTGRIHYKEIPTCMQKVLEKAGLRIAGVNHDGEVRIMELDHITDGHLNFL
jgi:hypothetical protein